jgi:hypothetical protein
VIELTEQEREELKRWSSSRTLPAGDVFKAKLILALADGVRYSRIETELNTSRPTIARWKARFEEGRIAGLEGRHKREPPQQGNTGGAGSSVEKDSAEAGGRQHALVLPKDGESNRAEPHYGPSNLGEDQTEAPSAGQLYGVQRSGLRRESG